ncbi:response regulator transcription factor [Amycolatopsis sp. H20-H5]|uniref:response regulator transcription factor n=1 Tax=Amycolatopsis sp. H20-H5 TaxID=3046309 RepID=UPI002DBD92D1|nr:response regulator transcription factor [Amycolatopsis sp. H20-H5]MEC3977524.1 response regulator transcription factor [Amycolatopsis sp. H20-H5]
MNQVAERIRVVVAGGHRLPRIALCHLLRIEFDVVATGGLDEAAHLVTRHRPDVVLLDVDAPRESVGRFPRVGGGAPVIVLGDHDDPAAGDLYALGACDYAHKNTSQAELFFTIRHALHGRYGQPKAHLQAVAPPGAAALKTLSARECEIVGYVGLALSNRQISRRLGITEGTVKQHLRNIFTKLGAVSRLDAVNRAMAAGLIADPPVARVFRDGTAT